MDFSLVLPLFIILVLLIGLKKLPHSKQKKKKTVINANCTVLLPQNKIAEAHLVKRGESESVVITEEFGKLTVPNHCVRFVGSLRELEVKSSSIRSRRA